ncbi:hypothetical protein EDD21DRAFT_376361 [Dissophora ornata]|nr:hypothetical protein EDD21DRAFT_376361 [Dissophora ornata]
MAATLDVLIAREPGKSVSVPYRDNEPIFFLIQRVSFKLGEIEGDFGGRDLFINGPIYCNMSNLREHFNLLTYRSIRKGNLKIFLRTCTGETRSFSFDPQHTISDVKNIIQREEGIPLHSYRLIFQARSLEDTRKLVDYKMTNGPTLYILYRLIGGGGGPRPSTQFTDVSNTEGVSKIQLSNSAPPGRSVSRGTNLECKCKCTPRYPVIYQQGVGTIELSQAKFICPNCGMSDKIIPSTVGFLECKYRFHGIKTTGQQYTSEWKDVTKEDAYQLFNPNNQTLWRRLIIESAELDDCEICTICLEKMRGTKLLGCGHRFHGHCYAQWNSSCPNCRFNQHLITG